MSNIYFNKQMEKYFSAFKAYDIRGLYKEQIDEIFSYNMGLAITNFLIEKGENNSHFIASDTRRENTTLIDYYLMGLNDGGWTDITNLGIQPVYDPNKKEKLLYGVCSTSMAYLFGKDNCGLGLSFTASHNPHGYVGMKFFYNDLSLLSTQFLKEIFVNNFTEKLPILNKKSALKPVTDNLQNKKIMLIKKLLSIKKKYKIVVDYSNGAACTYERNILSDLNNLQVIHINDTADGNFPNHESDTVEQHNYNQLSKKVLEHNADLGIMFDGDADRIGFVDEKGTYITGQQINSILAFILSKQNPSCNIVFDVMSGSHIFHGLKELGVPYKIVRTGRFFISQAMRENKSIFGGEASGHFLFADVGGAECPLYALWLILNHLESFDCMSKMIIHYQRFFILPMINLPFSGDSGQILERIRNFFSEKYNETSLDIDGLNIFADDFSVCVRSSNTTPILRISIDAKHQDLANKLLNEIQTLL